ncbi:PREDICTED: RING finger protein 17-like [Eufriesea mexicana]|uniref:RING finger protein 17-like n=1 Tax=Eufriesea mexicana TaxID=516756 RepID=UPI00083C56E0|nr:PREDICTED: RING finger protein 17-like [Eufriesea mexicana]
MIVTQHFTYLHGVLQNTERRIINSLREHQNAQGKNIEEILTQLNKHEERLQSALVISTSLTENFDKVDIRQVIRKLQTLVDIPCHLIQNIVPDEQEIKYDIDNSIIEAIEEHCHVHIPETSFFSLQRTDMLPDSYEIEPLTEEITTSQRVKAEKKSVARHPRKDNNFPAVGFSEIVHVTHVVDPSCFYVQLMQNQHKLSNLTKELATLANTTGTIPTEVTLNALYIAQYSKDKAWYRARVIDKKTEPNSDEKYSLLLIDYGMKEENVPLIRMRNIVPQFAILPVMGIRCSLFDIVPNNGKWHPGATQAFKNLVYTNSMVSICIKMITGDTYYVDLNVISSKDSGLISVKDSLTYMKYATCISPNRLMRTNPDSTRKYYKELLEIDTYTDVQILFVESPSSIYIQKTHANRSYFNKLIHEMTEDYERNTPAIESILVPYKDSPCAARGVDGLWHRGIICEVTENIVQVFYVDLGYTLILSYDAIRSLNTKYMSCRTQAIKISLKNIMPQSNIKNQWEPETTEFLKKFLVNTKNFRIIAFNKVENTYNVSMFTLDNQINVADFLVENGLALHIKSGSYDTESRNKKRTVKKNVNPIELFDELYNDPINLDKKDKGVEESEDPFKICVLIHQVQSPDCIYVSDATCDQSDIQQMMKEMQKFYSQYYSTKRDSWNKNSVCVVYFEKSNMYYRGEIVDIKSTDKVVVFLYDIGIEETISINNIQSLHSSFFKIPRYVFKIKLIGIYPCGGSCTWPSLSCEKLREIINNNQNSKFYISKLEGEDVKDSAIPVELWIKQVKIDGPLTPTRHEINSISRMLVEKGVALPVKEYAQKRDKILAIELKRQLVNKLERLTKYKSNVTWYKINDDHNDSTKASITKVMSQNLLYHSDFDSDSSKYDSMEKIFNNIPSLPKLSAWLPVKPIKEDKFIATPTYLDENGFLYIHSKTQNMKKIQYIEMKLEQLYNNYEHESFDSVWIEGDLCIVQYHANKKWYRGKIVKIRENDIIDVEFVDYGNVEECTTEVLKKKVALENIPIQCTKCLIYGLNPGNEDGIWITEDLDKIHCLLVEQECEVTIIDRTETHLIISLSILPNKYCNVKCDLIEFLVDKWKMNIKPNIETDISENSTSVTNTSNVIREKSEMFNSYDDVIEDIIISGNSVLPLYKDVTSENENDTIADIENLSWCKIKDEIITSTPNIASKENLSMNYKIIDIPKNINYIEVELCCSISPTEFYAQLKENTHSVILNTYYTQYEFLMNDLQENACKQPLITNLIPNIPCCAKFHDDLWYRCLITESEPIINSDDIEVKLLYIDYGNDEYRKVNSQQCQLYTLKKEWLDIPAIAIKCKLWNIKVASTADYNKLLSQLQKIYNTRIIATIKETDEEFFNVELYKDEKCENVIYNTLIDEGLFEIKSENN